MSINIHSNNPVQTNTETAAAIKTANLAKNQQSLEGEMALQLIQVVMNFYLVIAF